MLATSDTMFMEACSCAVDLYDLRLNVLEKLNALDTKSRILHELNASIPFEYYTEESNASGAAAQKKQGIIKRLWNAIINLFGSIKDFIFGKSLDKIDDNAEDDIPAQWTETSKIVDLGNKLKSINKATIVKTGILVLGAISAVVALFKVAGKHQQKMNHIKGSDAKKLAKIYGTNADVICKAARQIEGFDMELAMNAANTEMKDRTIRGKISDLSEKEKAASGWKNRKERADLNAAKNEQTGVWAEFRKNIPPEIKQYMDIIGNEVDKAGVGVPKDTSGLLAMIRTGLANVGKLLKDVAQQLVAKFSKKAKGGA